MQPSPRPPTRRRWRAADLPLKGEGGKSRLDREGDLVA
jgi:hypothetical protein